MPRRKQEIPPQIGEMVYLISDPDCKPRLITKIIVKADDMTYVLALGDKKSKHQIMEITRNPPEKRLEIRGLKSETKTIRK